MINYPEKVEELEGEIKDLEEKKEKINRNIESLEKEIDSLKNQISKQRQENNSSSKSDSSLIEVKNRLNEDQKQREKYQNALLEIENKLSKIKTRKKELKTRIVIDLIDENEETDEFGAPINKIKQLAKSQGVDEKTVDKIIKKEEKNGRLFSLGSIWVRRAAKKEHPVSRNSRRDYDIE